MRMRIPIEQLREGSRVFEFAPAASSFPVLRDMAGSGECRFASAVRVRLKAACVGEIVEVEGHLSTEVELACGRCLAPFTTSLESDFALTYLKAADAPAAEDLELTAEDAGLVYFRGEEIDLSEGIQEQVILAFPLRPLCRESCKGLCPACGADRNQAPCGCEAAPADGPFAALHRIRPETP
jgi:uncharacterized protein